MTWVLDTELRLASWRDGSTQAERLAATVLKLSGYEEVDPQAPLGGPDDAKDIVCSKGGLTWVGAVYFPATSVGFAAIKRKFVRDLSAAPDRHRGFAFLTNQALTLKQRAILADIADAQGKVLDTFHLERLCALLDSPSGYGVRLQYLRIAMSVEEQLSWSEESGSRLERALGVTTREVLAIKAMVQRLSTDSAEIVRTLTTAVGNSVQTPDLLATSNFIRDDAYDPVSMRLEPALVLLFHRLVCFDMPTRNVGVLRTTNAWLASNEGIRAEHTQPPDPREVPARLESLCATWRNEFATVAAATAEERRLALARFHASLLQIHPFVDGNGRAARAILVQQCLDLFGTANLALMNKGAAYYRALAVADAGDAAPLSRLLTVVTDG